MCGTIRLQSCVSKCLRSCTVPSATMARLALASIRQRLMITLGMQPNDTPSVGRPLLRLSRKFCVSIKFSHGKAVVKVAYLARLFDTSPESEDSRRALAEANFWRWELEAHNRLFSSKPLWPRTSRNLQLKILNWSDLTSSLFCHLKSMTDWCH